jgi:predicted RNA-binding protein Jag
VKTQAAQELVQGILVRMGVQAVVQPDDRDDGIHLTLQVSSNAEALGNRRSGVVDSLGYLVNKAVNREEAGRKWVFIHHTESEQVADAPVAPGQPAPAPGQADPEVASMAERLAQKAKGLGGALWVGPLPAPQRQALQSALGRVPGVKVRAEGEGIHRRLVVEVA